MARGRWLRLRLLLPTPRRTAAPARPRSLGDGRGPLLLLLMRGGLWRPRGGGSGDDAVNVHPVGQVAQGDKRGCGGRGRRAVVPRHARDGREDGAGLAGLLSLWWWWLHTPPTKTHINQSLPPPNRRTDKP